MAFFPICHKRRQGELSSRNAVADGTKTNETKRAKRKERKERPSSTVNPPEEWNMYRLLYVFEFNSDIISRVNGEVISRGKAECNLAISSEIISELHEKACNYPLMFPQFE